MKIIQRAVMKHPDGREQKFALFEIEKTVFRWTSDPSGQPWDGIDYLTGHDAVKSLRVYVETDPAMVGVDLTIIPEAPLAVERAARRILDLWLSRHALQVAGQNEIEDIIREETGLDKLVESVNLYLTYRYPRLRQARPGGLDLTEGGLILGMIEALEVSMQQSLANLKAKLSEGIEEVRPYTTMPTGRIN